MSLRGSGHLFLPDASCKAREKRMEKAMYPSKTDIRTNGMHCISSLYADTFWQDQVCMKHGRYDRSLSVACLRISITFHVTCVNVTNLGICRRDQRGWESSCQREAASGLPDIGKPSFHQIICIYIYICIHHTSAASSCAPRILYAICMHTPCARVKAWHGLHLLWHWWGCRWLCERCCGLGQTWFKLPKLHVSAVFRSLHPLFDLVSCLGFVEQLNFMIGFHPNF